MNAESLNKYYAADGGLRAGVAKHIANADRTGFQQEVRSKEAFLTLTADIV